MGVIEYTSRAICWIPVRVWIAVEYGTQDYMDWQLDTDISYGSVYVTNWIYFGVTEFKHVKSRYRK